MKIETLPTYKDKKSKKKSNNLYSYSRYHCMHCLYRHKITTQKGEVISHTDIM